MDEKVSKRILVTSRTWARLSNLKKPDQTFDDLVGELIDLYDSFARWIKIKQETEE